MAQWVKGESGNPGGRPREVANLRELARTRTAEALETLAQVMNDPTASASARVSAACALLDRGHGRPTSSTDHEGTLIDMTATSTENDREEVEPMEVARRIAYILGYA